MFSVVIPLYNKAHTIETTIKSVLNQTLPDFELIIVNDGSTDNGVAVIEEKFKDSRIKIINQSNQGVSVARNTGVANARFEHIAFLDGDDEWMPDYLLKMKQAITKYPDAGLYCSAGLIRHGDGTQSFRIAKKYSNTITEIDFFQNPHVFLHTSATVVTKAIFSKTSGFPVGMRCNEDFALFFSVALKAKVIYLGYLLSVYMGGVTGQATQVLETDGGMKKEMDTVKRHNLVYQNWLNEGSVNKSYLIFLLYELRHSIKSHLMNNDFNTINYYFSNLNPELQAHFLRFEKYLYSNKALQKLGLIFINLTKIRWRMRGFDVVDTKAYKIE